MCVIYGYYSNNSYDMLFFNYTTHNIRQFLHAFKKLNKTSFRVFNSKIYQKCCICYRKLHTSHSGPWKVLFFGTDDFALESLKVLHSKYESKVLQRLEVVTTDQKKENSVMKYARQNKIVVNKWPVEVNKSEFHIGIVVSFGHLIPSKIINAFPLGMVNIHGSLLPRWRGAAPIIYTLMNGDSKAGITLMKIMPKKFDVGEIVMQKHIDINDSETMPELYAKLAKLGAKSLGEMFENLPGLLHSVEPQAEINVTYAPKVTSAISLVNWNEMSAKNVHNLHRALLGLYPLATTFNNLKVKLFDVQKIESESSIAKRLKEEVPGTVIYDKKWNALIVKCKEESFVSVKKITVQGKRSMSALDFYNGFISGKNKTKILFS